MANSNQTKKTRSSRRPTKAEIERKKAIRRMVVSLVLTFIFIFAFFRLGALRTSSLQSRPSSSRKFSLSSRRPLFFISSFLNGWKSTRELYQDF